MTLALRTAREEGHTEAEMWLMMPLPTGIREIGWTDCSRDFQLLLPNLGAS